MGLEMRSSVHNRTEYLNWEWSPNWVTWFVAIETPVMLSTLVVLIKMLYKYLKTDASSLLHPHLFISMMMMGIFNMVFFIFDSLTFRLPTTGYLTAWCASLEPNRALVYIYIVQLLSTYWSMFFTLQFCIIRLIIFVFPGNHKTYTKFVLPIYSLLAFFLPFISPYFMYTAKGYCRQWDNVFDFGAVFISYYDTYNGVRHDLFFTPVTVTVPVVITIVNGIFAYYAEKHASNPHMKNKVFNGKTKCALFYTNLAMTIPYAAHCILTILTAFVVPSWSPYSIIIRTPLTDVAHLSVILFYYFSHQLFNGQHSANAIQPASSITPQIS